MSQKAAFETMHYLIVTIVAIAIGSVTATITDAIEHVRWVSLLLGLSAGAVTFGLGATKTSLDIIDKRLDIRKKKRDEENSNAKILVPTEEQIKAYRGVVHRQVTRNARKVVNQQERLDSTVDDELNSK
jgi:riboflavin biosynthesis pyrimidine reductase